MRCWVRGSWRRWCSKERRCCISRVVCRAAVAGVGEEPAVEGEEPVAAVERPKKVGTGRIKSFASEGKVASEFRGKPVDGVIRRSVPGLGR